MAFDLGYYAWAVAGPAALHFRSCGDLQGRLAGREAQFAPAAADRPINVGKD
jgi:hypothetical protein